MYVNPRHRKEKGWRPEKPVSPFAPDQPPRESPWRMLGEGQELRVLSPKRGASDDKSFDKKTHSLSDIEIYYSKCKEVSMGMKYVWSEGLGNQPHTVRSSGPSWEPLRGTGQKSHFRPRSPSLSELGMVECRTQSAELFWDHWRIWDGLEGYRKGLGRRSVENVRWKDRWGDRCLITEM